MSRHKRRNGDSINPYMSAIHRIACALLLVGCGNVKSDDTAADGPAQDSPDNPSTTVSVSNTGDDANDGIAGPVKTLKRAIGIAAANPTITTIALATGRYEGATGETFPYTVPPNITIHGPAGGGAVLVGTAAVPGLVVDAGTLRDLELETFMVAITSRAATTLTNVRVRDSVTAVQGEAGALLTVDGLDITGATGACALGIALNGTADLKATNVATRTLGSALEAREQSTVDLAANITGDASCAQAVIISSTTRAFALRDTIIDGGKDGISFTAVTQATLTNTTIRNLTNDALLGKPVFTMTGGALIDNGRAGLEVSGGEWTFTNVAIKNHPVMGIYFQNGSTPGKLKLRGCTVTGNRTGVYLFAVPVGVDLGTAASPGGNIFQGNAQYGVEADTSSGTPLIPAVGNTWRPNVQGADATGKYATPATINGPVDLGAGTNFSVNTGCSLSR